MRPFSINIVLFVFLIIFSLSRLSAEVDWRKYGWQIYDNAGEARALAMGTAGAAYLNPGTYIWNPGITMIGVSQHLSYGHQSRFVGMIQSDFLSLPLETKSKKQFNLIILHESVGKIPNTTDLLLDWGSDGVPNTGDSGENNGVLDDGERLDSKNVSYFNQHQFGIHLSSTITLFNLDIGIGLRSLIHTLGNNWGSGIGLDIGIVKSYWNNGYLGLSLRNAIPAMMVWDSGFVELEKPQILSGLSQNYNIQTIDLQFGLLGDLIINIGNESLNDDFRIGSTGFNWRIGFEAIYKGKINIRFGRTQYSFITTGLGLNWKYMSMNYAYQFNSNSSDLGSSHVFSFDINTNWIKSKIK